LPEAPKAVSAFWQKTGPFVYVYVTFDQVMDVSIYPPNANWLLHWPGNSKPGNSQLWQLQILRVQFVSEAPSAPVRIDYTNTNNALRGADHIPVASFVNLPVTPLALFLRDPLGDQRTQAKLIQLRRIAIAEAEAEPIPP
jgi:hypothetical protein